MQRATIVRLIEKAIAPGDTAWADFGSGDGAFTRVLRELLGPAAEIYSIDADASRLRRQRTSLEGPSVSAAAGSRALPLPRTHFIEADFTRPLDLPPLDGILLANALHFVPHDSQAAFLRQLRAYVKRGAEAIADVGGAASRVLIVEYEMRRASMWVPYPISFAALESLVADANSNAKANTNADIYEAPVLLSTTRSQYGGGQIYSALIRTRA